MEALQKEQLISAATKTLRVKKSKGLSALRCLNLCAEILAVDAGLKPAFLFDYSRAGAEQLRDYIQDLQKTGVICQHLHILSLGDNVLILNLSKTIRHLEKSLQRNWSPLIDVSARRAEPTLADASVVEQVKTQVEFILVHLKSHAVNREMCDSKRVSTSEIFSPEWNLCTLFGFLLGFPASYWFDFTESFENCLSMTELRVFSASAICSGISKDLEHRMYSFSVPETVYLDLQHSVETWKKDLQSDFDKQSVFSDLSISTQTVSLPAVAL